MKKTIRFFGIIFLAALIGFSFAACGGGDDPSGEDPLEGTWVSETLRLVAKDGSIKEYLIPGGTEVIRASYTWSGNTVSATITEVNGAMVTGGWSNWIAYASLPENWKENFPAGMTLTIVSDSFTITDLQDKDQTFVRAPNFDGTWTHSATIEDDEVTLTYVINGGGITIEMEDSDGQGERQKGKFTFSSTMIYISITDNWDSDEDDWEPTGDVGELTFEYEHTGNKFTLSDGKFEGEPNDMAALFEGEWTRS